MYSEGIPETKESSGPSRKGIIKFLRYTVGLGLAIFLLIILGMFLTGRLIALEVGGNSMAPTLVSGDRLLARALAPDEVIGRGDLVLVTSPDDNGPDMIKRVVAVPGDTVAFRNREFFVNGNPAPPPGRDRSIHMEKEDESHDLGPGEYFVLGDNRGSSHDSEEFGPLSREYIHSRLIYRYAPWPRRGRF